MKSILCGITLALFLFSCGMVSASEYSINGNIDINDVNVFYSQIITPNMGINFNGEYSASFEQGIAFGHLILQSDKTLLVAWTSNENTKITQNDNYAVKIITDASISRNGFVTYEPIYVNYNKLTNQIVIRGYGFRIATQ